MALTWTAIGDDICIQEGNAAYNFKASGTIKAGQVVHMKDTLEVRVCPTTDDVGVVGVADYDVTDNDYVAVWGPGNIVRVRCSGAVTVGDALQVNSLYGHLGNRTDATSAKVAIALETKAADTTNGAIVKVLLV